MTLSRFTEIDPGLFRGPRPTEEELKAFDPSLKTIVDLEPAKYPEAAIAEALGIRVVPIPISSVTKPKLEDVEWAASIMSKPENRPCLCHCAQGVDRTGIVCAFWRVRYCLWTPQAAFQEMLKSGFHRIRYFFWMKDIHALLDQAVLSRDTPAGLSRDSLVE